MRTLYFRITVTFTVGLLFCLVALTWFSIYLSRRTTGEFFEGSARLQLQQARRAFETGGPQALKGYLDEVDTVLRDQRYLVDNHGRDLVSGATRPDLHQTEFNIFGLPKTLNGKLTIITWSNDGRYALVLVVTPPLGMIWFLPFFGITGLLLIALAWQLSSGIVAPLLKVAATVERFGRGDLSARLASRRKDEIGRVSRAFDGMAERIETLLTAERRLLQDVSHELRSPLARLSFATELMKNAPDQEAAAARVQREVERLTRLVQTLIEVTSAEGDPASRKREKVDIAALLQEIVEDCAFEVKVRDVHIEAVSTSQAIVEGDLELLRRAIENVLRNAIRYSPEHTSVAVELAEKGENVTVTIRDLGPGVPEDKLARIFDPFFRVSDSRDSADGGMGLGLSIARRAIFVHHGQIHAENASPGLKVTLTVPLSGASRLGPHV